MGRVIGCASWFFAFYFTMFCTHSMLKTLHLEVVRIFQTKKGFFFHLHSLNDCPNVCKEANVIEN